MNKRDQKIASMAIDHVTAKLRGDLATRTDELARALQDLHAMYNLLVEIHDLIIGPSDAEQVRKQIQALLTDSGKNRWAVVMGTEKEMLADAPTDWECDPTVLGDNPREWLEQP